MSLVCFIIGQMYGIDPGVETQTYTYNVPEEIRRFIHFFHQHVTEQVSTNNGRKLYRTNLINSKFNLNLKTEQGLFL